MALKWLEPSSMSPGPPSSKRTSTQPWLVVRQTPGHDLVPEVRKSMRRAHPALHNANLSDALVVGEPVALVGRHAKVRRNGYQTRSA